jgi:Holliday junction resolvase RusA-like endonuclease
VVTVTALSETDPLRLDGPPEYRLLGPMLSFHVLGTPVGQGRITTYGKGRSVHSNAERLLPWRESVQHAAEDAIGTAVHPVFPLDGPAGLHAYFTMPKPKSAPKKRTTYPVTRPDLSHLLRAVEDALQAAGVFKDDAQLIDETTAKVYPGEHAQALHVPGVLIRVYSVDSTDLSGAQ